MTVLVNPAQLEALQEHLASLTGALGVVGRVRWAADPAITAGGVKVITRRGEIDATIETQLANVADALAGTTGTTGTAAARGQYLSDGAGADANADADDSPSRARQRRGDPARREPNE